MLGLFCSRAKWLLLKVSKAGWPVLLAPVHEGQWKPQSPAPASQATYCRDSWAAVSSPASVLVIRENPFSGIGDNKRKGAWARAGKAEGGPGTSSRNTSGQTGKVHKVAQSPANGLCDLREVFCSG